MDDLLQQGITAFRAGQRDESRKFLIAAVKENPESERAWGWMYNIAINDQERIHCLKQMLRINPKNEKANQLLNELTDSQLSSVPHQPLSSKPINNQNISSSLTKICPYCAEEIQEAAIICRHCGRDLMSSKPSQHQIAIQPIQERPVVKSKSNNTKIGVFLIVAIICVCVSFSVFVTLMTNPTNSGGTKTTTNLSKTEVINILEQNGFTFFPTLDNEDPSYINSCNDIVILRPRVFLYSINLTDSKCTTEKQSTIMNTVIRQVYSASVLTWISNNLDGTSKKKGDADGHAIIMQYNASTGYYVIMIANP
jgi:hypothetical protein